MLKVVSNDNAGGVRTEYDIDTLNRWLVEKVRRSGPLILASEYVVGVVRDVIERSASGSIGGDDPLSVEYPLGELLLEAAMGKPLVEVSDSELLLARGLLSIAANGNVSKERFADITIRYMHFSPQYFTIEMYAEGNLLVGSEKFREESGFDLELEMEPDAWSSTWWNEVYTLA